MAIMLSCANCSTKLKVSPESAGKKVRCPKCKNVIQVLDAMMPATPVVPKKAQTARPTPATEIDVLPAATPAAPALPGHSAKFVVAALIVAFVGLLLPTPYYIFAYRPIRDSVEANKPERASRLKEMKDAHNKLEEIRGHWIRAFLQGADLEARVWREKEIDSDHLPGEAQERLYQIAPAHYGIGEGYGGSRMFIQFLGAVGVLLFVFGVTAAASVWLIAGKVKGVLLGFAIGSLLGGAAGGLWVWLIHGDGLFDVFISVEFLIISAILGGVGLIGGLVCGALAPLTREKRLTRVFAGLMLLSLVGLFVWPYTRAKILGRLSGEPFVGGMPLSYWRSTLTDENEGGSSMHAIVTLQDEESYSALTEALKHPRQRLSAISALRRLGSPEGNFAIEPLVQLMRQEAPDTYAASALDGFGPEAIPLVAKALDDNSPRVRTTAVKVLGSLGRRHKAPELLPHLETALKDTNSDTRNKAVEAIIALGPVAKSFAPALAQALEREGMERSGDLHRVEKLIALRRIDPDSWSLLLPLLKHHDERIRATACAGIGDYGHKAREALPLLVVNLKDFQPRIRNLAADALWCIDPEAAAKEGLKRK